MKLFNSSFGLRYKRFSSASHNSPMNSIERRTTTALSSILCFRMLGLFLILPVLALYTDNMSGATPLTIGLALGIYGLTQAVLQLPFGFLSDKFGRKRLIVIGLILFALGSIVAAMASSIEFVILGRALQGSGAIAAVTLALLADVTRENQRTKAVALMGMSIGFSFVLALILGPILDAWIGLPGIFWSTAFLALAAIPVVIWLVPTVSVSHMRVISSGSPSNFLRTIEGRQLLALNCGIFVTHMMITAFFVAVPLYLLENYSLPIDAHWQVYVPVLAAAVLGVLPLLALSMSRGKVFLALRTGIGILLLSPIVLFVGDANFGLFLFGLWLFFLAFTLLEALMPSLVTRLAPSSAKGSYIGVFNTFQFMGTFIGGVIGGWIFGINGGDGVFMFGTVAVLGLFILFLVSPVPQLLESVTITLKKAPIGDFSRLMERFRDLPGVHDVILLPEEYIVYLKVDPKRFNNDSTADIIGLD